MRRGAVGRVGERLVVGVLQRLDRRIRLHIPVEIVGAGRLGADHAHRRALGIGAEHAHHAGGDAEIDAAGDHRLLGLARAVGVDDLELEAVLLEDAGELADLRDRGVPVAALADRQFHLVERGRGVRRSPSSVKVASAQASAVFLHRILPSAFLTLFCGLSRRRVRAALRCRRRGFASSSSSAPRLHMS